jgi:glycosyltransferase involved in cell wall biosynthesis
VPNCLFDASSALVRELQELQAAETRAVEQLATADLEFKRRDEEVAKLAGQVVERDRALADMQGTVARLQARIAEQQGQLEEIEAEAVGLRFRIAAIEESNGWALVQLLGRARLLLAPDGTSRDRLCRVIVKGLRKLQRDGATGLARSVASRLTRKVWRHGDASGGLGMRRETVATEMGVTTLPSSPPPTAREPHPDTVAAVSQPQNPRTEHFLKLDLGCGPYKRGGFLGIDIEPHPGVDWVHDLNKGLPFDDGCVDHVYCSHALEHFEDPLFVLDEIHRVCIDNATVELIVPLHDTSLGHITTFDPQWFHMHLDPGRFGILHANSVEKSGISKEGQTHQWTQLEIALRVRKQAPSNNGSAAMREPLTQTTIWQPKHDGEALDIVYIVPSYLVCGGHRVVFEHADGLAGRGHRVTVVRVSHDGGSSAWFPFEHEVHFADLSAFAARWPRVDCAIATYHKTFRYLLDLPSRVKRFYLVQSDERRFYDAITRDYFECEETYRIPGVQLLVVAKWLHMMLLREFSRESVYVPNRVNPRDFFPEPSQLLYEKGRTMVVLIEGNAEAPKKGVRLALEAIAGLNCAKWLLTNSERLPGYVGGFDRVFQLPPQPEIRRIYTAADIVVKPSFWEGSPLPHLEAMVCGTALVTTDATGIDEYCADAHNCLVVSVGDVEALRTATKRLLEDDDLRSKLASNAKETAKGFLGWSPSVEVLEAALYAGDTPGPFAIKRSEVLRAIDTAYGTYESKCGL